MCIALVVEKQECYWLITCDLKHYKDKEIQFLY